jgi:signal transduction histidine kinase
MLADNAGNNLTPKQIEYAQTIHGSGTDLLSIINDILDLAKIESGTVTLNIELERFSELQDYVERTFRQVANDKGLEFDVELASGLPAAAQTDEKRLQQILKNLLSNAFILPSTARCHCVSRRRNRGGRRDIPSSTRRTRSWRFP